jgi:hypothetical protein
VHVPLPLVIVTVPLEIEHTPDAPIDTVSPGAVVVALTANEVLYAAGDAGAGNVMVWLTVVAVTVWTTLVAELYSVLPD